MARILDFEARTQRDRHLPPSLIELSVWCGLPSAAGGNLARVRVESRDSFARQPSGRTGRVEARRAEPERLFAGS